MAAEQPEATHKLEAVEVFKIDLVKRPATRDKFLVVRSEGGQKMPRAAMSPEQFKARYESLPESVPVADVTQPEEVERRVPPADATTDAKRKAQKDRAVKYGIEVLEGKGENLSYPSKGPTVESLYGDPSNLKYPLGYEDNKVDLARANNARARFKQAFAVYTKTQSRRVIHNRIVAAQLKAGADPSYNPDDQLDRLLSKEIKEKLQRQVQRTEEMEEDTMSTKLDEAVDRFGALIERMEGIFANPSQEQGGPTEEPKKEDEMKAEEKPEEEAKVEAGKETIVETPQEAPQTVATEPVADTAPAVVETPVAPVATSEAVPAFDPSMIATGMEKMGAVVERFAATMDAVQKTVDGLADRIGKVERSVKTGNAEPQDETEKVERDEGKSSFWGGLLTG